MKNPVPRTDRARDSTGLTYNRSLPLGCESPRSVGADGMRAKLNVRVQLKNVIGSEPLIHVIPLRGFLSAN